MSGRPKRASAQAALAAIKKTDKRSKREEEETEAPDEEENEPPSKRRKTSSVQPLDFPVLPADVWAIIIAFSFSKTRNIQETLSLRTTCKSWAVATSADSGHFWKRLSAPLLGGANATILEKVVHESYGGGWHGFFRYCLSSRLILPSIRGNPSHSGYCGPAKIPRKPKFSWVYRGPKIATLTLQCWQDRAVFITHSAEVKCISLLTGEEIWSQKIENAKELEIAQEDIAYVETPEASLEICVAPTAASVASCGGSHFDFLPAHSIICAINRRMIVSLDFISGAVNWVFDLSEASELGPGKKELVGGIIVLPYCTLSSYRELPNGDVFSFAIQSRISTPETNKPKLLWQTNLLVPGHTVSGPPAAELEHGYAVFPTSESLGESQLKFHVVCIYDGRTLSTIEDVEYPIEPRYTSEAWIALRGTRIYYLFNATGEEAYIQSFDAFAGTSRVETPRANDSGQEESEEAEEDEDDDQSTKEKGKPTTKPERKVRAFDGEFSFDFCLDTQRNMVFLPGAWSGGGGAYDTSLFGISLSGPVAQRTVWMLDDNEKGSLQKAYGAEVCSRTSIYGFTYATPLCDGTGATAWISNEGSERVLITADAKGKAMAYMYLKVPDEDESLQSGPEDEIHNLANSALRLAQQQGPTGKSMLLAATEDWIWASSD